MRKRLRVAIVGYGTGGQASALMLSADGHDVEVFERAPALGPVGAGLLLQPTGLAVLWEMGLLDGALAHGAVVTRLYGQNQRGRPVMDMRYGDLDKRLFGVGLQRGALFALLDAARRAHVGIYHFWSRWLTPLFQSERDFAARWRDWLFHPMSRMPGARRQMLRVLSGTRKGLVGRMGLPEGFVEVLRAVAEARESASSSRELAAFDVPAKSVME